MKKVLIIAYSFPPMAVVGVYRTIKFVKYLRDFGWQPVIITLKEPFDWSYNHELFKDIPQDVKIYRTRLFKPLVWWENLTAKMKHKKFQADNSGEVAVIAHSEQTGKKPKSFIKKVRGFAAAALSTPDKSLFWIVTALPKAYRIIKKEKIDCIYVSTPPHSNHLIGYYLKKITGLPFVADFRAPWTQNEYFDDYKKIKFFKDIENRMELAVHKSADAVISNSTFECEGYRRKYAPLVGEKFHPILNGYDPDDFKNLPAKSYDKFTIVYVGGLYGRRNPNLFLEGVKLFLEKHPDLRKDFQMLFI
ncbi:MAG: glycosyltransferase family 4 protein, partial [FCB group bacterium]|nr:glycosyltransferase family 4 protein [FCB group bacterium]